MKTHNTRTITVFGNGSEDLSAQERQRARRLGEELARRGFIVCNGGYGGTMAAAAEGAKTCGGHTAGVTLAKGGWGGANQFMDEVDVQPDLPSRIARLLARGDGYVILAGGTGTLAELGLLLEMLGKSHMPARPTVLLGGFWLPLAELLAAEGVFRNQGVVVSVDGVRLIGMVAQTESPEAAARFLAANLLG